MGETNSVSFQFDHVGEIVYPASTASADDMLEAAIEAGAGDVDSDAELHVVISAPEDFNSVRDALEARFGPADSARLAWRPLNSAVIDEETAASLFKLIETLEDSDDVQNVYANFEVGDDVLARLERLIPARRGILDRAALGGRMRVLGLDPGPAAYRLGGHRRCRAIGSAMSPTGSFMRRSTARWPSGSFRCSGSSATCSSASARMRRRSRRPSSTRTPASTLRLGVARGVVLLAPAERGVPVAEYSANMIKKSVVGAGHAGKEQVQMMVRRLLPGCAIAEPDAADALAVAICHAHHAGTVRAWQARAATPAAGTRPVASPAR